MAGLAGALTLARGERSLWTPASSRREGKVGFQALNLPWGHSGRPLLRVGAFYVWSLYPET